MIEVEEGGNGRIELWERGGIGGTGRKSIGRNPRRTREPKEKEIKERKKQKSVEADGFDEDGSLLDGAQFLETRHIQHRGQEITQMRRCVLMWSNHTTEYNLFSYYPTPSSPPTLISMDSASSNKATPAYSGKSAITNISSSSPSASPFSAASLSRALS